MEIWPNLLCMMYLKNTKKIYSSTTSRPSSTTSSGELGQTEDQDMIVNKGLLETRERNENK